MLRALGPCLLRGRRACSSSPPAAAGSLLRLATQLSPREDAGGAGAADAWLRALPLTLVEGFLSPGDEAALLAALEPRLRARRYEKAAHWDGVAAGGFREVSVLVAEMDAAAAAPLRRVWARFFPAPGGAVGPPQPHAHALDLAPAAALGAHVDSVKFSGGVVAGLSLCCDGVMTLAEAAPAGRPPRALAVRLPRRSLYVLQGAARYEYTHAIEPRSERRVSVILRDEVVAAAPAPGSGAR
jgi:hypothetical protein